MPPIKPTSLISFLRLSFVEEFKASSSWCRRFMKRRNLVIRRISGSGRSFKPDTAKVTTDYLKELRSIIALHNFQPNEIINGDESSYYMDSVGSTSVATKGSRKVYAKSTGKEKVRISCLMAAAASGEKLPVLTVVPRKKKIESIESIPEMKIIYESKGK